MYHKVGYDRLSTRYDEDPVVTFQSDSGVTSVRLEFCSSYIGDDGLAWRTIVDFPRVLDFRFFDLEIGLRPPNDDDMAFALVEIEDSDTLAQFASCGALDRTTMPVIQLADLHHYRIAFDENGVYDAISTSVEVSYRRVPH